MLKNISIIVIAALISTLVLAQVKQLQVPLLDSSGADTGDTVTVNATVAIQRGGTTLPPVIPPTGNLLGAIQNWITNEREQLTYVIPVTNSNARVFLEDMPPGATFDEATRTFSFFPDFTQSGDYTVKIKAYASNETSEGTFLVRVNNSIVPPDPVITNTTPQGTVTIHDIALTSDGFLDPPGTAGTVYNMKVTVPNNASVNNLMPLRIFLHGSGGAGSAGQGSGGRFSFGPYENFVGWHTGRHSDYPNTATAASTVPNTTQRKALHVLDWITRTFPGVDRNKVDVLGASMGGSGSIFFAIRYGYHITRAHSTNGMTSFPLNTAAQKTAMEANWGAQALNLKDDLGMSVWDRFDITRALRDDAYARDVFYTTKNGATDNIIEFHHVSTNSPITGLSWAQALQQYGVVHRIFWDKGGHGVSDTEMPAFWTGEPPATNGLSPLAKFALNKAYPAFTSSSIDRDPPLYDFGSDSFISNDAQGGRNRHLAWVSDSIVDEHTSFSMPLFVVTRALDPNQDPNLPVFQEGHQGALPVTVDVTLRRVQRFKGLPGEVIPWTFGSQSGNVTVAANGDIKITGLNLTGAQQTLSLSRTL